MPPHRWWWGGGAILAEARHCYTEGATLRGEATAAPVALGTLILLAMATVAAIVAVVVAGAAVATFVAFGSAAAELCFFLFH